MLSGCLLLHLRNKHETPSHTGSPQTGCDHRVGHVPGLPYPEGNSHSTSTEHKMINYVRQHSISEDDIVSNTLKIETKHYSGMGCWMLKCCGDFLADWQMKKRGFRQTANQSDWQKKRLIEKTCHLTDTYDWEDGKSVRKTDKRQWRDDIITPSGWFMLNQSLWQPGDVSQGGWRKVQTVKDGCLYFSLGYRGYT